MVFFSSYPQSITNLFNLLLITNYSFVKRKWGCSTGVEQPQSGVYVVEPTGPLIYSQ